MLHEPSLRTRVRANLDAFSRRAHTDADLRAAAVALALVTDEWGNACFLLTRRAEGLRAHGGQWALPGGRIDPGESAADAALLIGDPALRFTLRSRGPQGEEWAREENLHIYDLAEEWARLTNLPFVFAFWAVRGDRVRDPRQHVGEGRDVARLVARQAVEFRGDPAHGLGVLRGRGGGRGCGLGEAQ